MTDSTKDDIIKLEKRKREVSIMTTRELNFNYKAVEIFINILECKSVENLEGIKERITERATAILLNKWK